MRICRKFLITQPLLEISLQLKNSEKVEGLILRLYYFQKAIRVFLKFLKKYVSIK